MKKVAFFTFALFFTLKALAQSADIGTGLTETPLQVKTLSGVVAGSLVMPANAAGKVPLVIIIGDSGPVDRDGNNAKTGLTANIHKLLAVDLGKSGIATLRFDKRNVGESISTTKESQLHIEDYNDDVVTLINQVKDDQRFSGIILFGHGEGSLVSLLAAYTGELPLKALVLAEGAGVTADKILVEQMKSKPKYQQDEFQTLLDSMKKGKTIANIDLALYYIARPSVQPFLMSWCRYPPDRALKKVKIPVLIIHGTTDLLIPVSNAEKLKKAKSDAVLLIIKDMNHILKDAPADEEKNMATYSDPALPLKPEMVTGMVDFISKLK